MTLAKSRMNRLCLRVTVGRKEMCIGLLRLERSSASRNRKLRLVLSSVLVWSMSTGDSFGFDLHGGHNIAAEAGSRFEEEQIDTLKAGHATDGALGPSGRHTFEVSLASHQYLHVTVETQDLDVTLSIALPKGSPALKKLSSYGLQEPVDACLVARVAGDYELVVEATAKNKKMGHYKIRLDTIRQATALDEIRARAESDIAEAQQLRENATAESRRDAIRRYEQALPLLKGAGDRLAEAETLESLGSLHNDIGNNKRAIELLRRSLSLFQSLRDRRGESMASNDIGSVENDLGDNKTALIDLNQALSIRKEIGDRRGEAETLEYIGDVYENTSDTERALQNYNEALDLRRNIGDLQGEAQSLDDIGVAYYDIDEEETAFDYFDKALPIYRELHDLWGEALTLNNFGAAYDSLGDKRKALGYFTRTIPLKRAVGQ